MVFLTPAGIAKKTQDVQISRLQTCLAPQVTTKLY